MEDSNSPVLGPSCCSVSFPVATMRELIGPIQELPSRARNVPNSKSWCLFENSTDVPIGDDDGTSDQANFDEDGRYGMCQLTMVKECWLKLLQEEGCSPSKESEKKKTLSSSDGSC